MSAKCYQFMTCLLKVYTMKAKAFGSHVLSCLCLQGSAAAESGCSGKF